MPIGKNSIKRVKNNGYSQVSTAAPDMENSVIVNEPQPEAQAHEVKTEATAEKRKPGRPRGSKSKKPAEKKPRAAAKTVTEKKTVKKTASKGRAGRPKKSAPAVQQERQSEGYVNLGGKLPYYLL